MEGFCDAFDHYYELVVRGGRDRALGHKVAYDRRGVAETKQKCYRGTPCGAFRREGEAARGLPGWLGPKGDAGLALKPSVAGADRGERLESRSPKRTCALGTQLIAWLAIRGLIWNAQRPLPGAPTVGVSNKHRLVNL